MRCVYDGAPSDVFESQGVVLLRVENDLLDVAQEVRQCLVLSVVHLLAGREETVRELQSIQ